MPLNSRQLCFDYFGLETAQTDELEWVRGFLLSLTLVVLSLSCLSPPCTVSLCEQAGMFVYSMAL